MTAEPEPSTHAGPAFDDASHAEVEAASPAPSMTVFADGSVTTPPPASTGAPQSSSRPSILAWHERALAGIKQLHEDEEHRLSLNARLS